jgi:Glu-tRNA(Gln) amidotransferase subunit E-like FAD-binding protein
MAKITSGLEIHQQLDSHKLFCNCPSLLRKDEPEFKVSRRLHAVAGEAGEVDVAARYAAEQEKEFVYEGYDSTCLVELDEEPPHEINQEALKIGLQVAMHLNCEILPITQIMRKTVLDGSNTGGFQRTVLIARDGYIETKSGRVGIWFVYLEEDAARKVSEEGNKKTYKLDRLGIPMLEIVTAPDIKSAEQAKEVALHIGDILRSCKVKRGIGTIRQDINVSIPGHPRAEIKGFQDPDIFIDVVNKEAERQAKNLKEKSKDELIGEVRGANVDGSTKFLRPLPGAARMYPETDLPLLKISREMINEAKRDLPKLRTEIHGELEKYGLQGDLIKHLMTNNLIEEYKSLLKVLNEPQFVGRVLIELPREIAGHEGKDVKDALNLEVIEEIVKAVANEKIEKSDVKHVMTEIVNGKSFEEAIKIEKVDLGDVEKEIAEIVKKKPGLSIGGYMGLIMAKFKGKVNGKEATAILEKLLNRKF